LKKLQDGLKQAGLAPQGEPVWARFDPPWTPWFLRRNEIWIELDPSPSTGALATGHALQHVAQ
jgi:hypothetical protein